MTDRNKDKLTGLMFAVVGGLIVGVSMLFLTSATDGSKELKSKVNQLDKEKADITYVDQKCLEVKSESDDRFKQIDQQLIELNRKTDKILELMITKK